MMTPTQKLKQKLITLVCEDYDDSIKEVPEITDSNVDKLYDEFCENVYMEVSGLPPQNLLTYFPELERIAHKIIYGSDWPSVPTFKENIEALQDLNINAEAKRMILGENAARILKI